MVFLGDVAMARVGEQLALACYACPLLRSLLHRLTGRRLLRCADTADTAVIPPDKISILKKSKVGNKN